MDDSQKLDILWKQMQSYRELLGDPSEVDAVLDELGHDSVVELLESGGVADESLSSRIRRLEEATSVADGGAVPSTDWDRDRQVRHVRATACKKARESGNGRAAFDVNDVATMFDYDISDGQCYKLLRIAAEYDEERGISQFDGFTFDKDDGDRQRVLVNTDAVRDDASFHAVRTPEQQEGVE